MTDHTNPTDNQPYDPFTALTGTDRPVHPRPEFAADLWARLERMAVEAPTDNESATSGEEGNPMTGTDHTASPTPGPDYLADTGGVSNLFYFTIPGPDIERSKAFFGAVLGWRVEGGSLGGHVANVTPPGGIDPTATTTDTRAVYLTVFDLDAALDRLRQLGGTVEYTTGYETGRMAACRDDQGTRFNLQEPSAAFAEHARNPTKGANHGDLFYFSIPSPDGDAGRRFYRSLLGWDFGPQGDQGGMHAANMITDGGIGAGREGDRPDFWFRVDDMEASLATVRSVGGTADEPMDTPQGTVCRCTDDQGVEFNLIQPA